MFLWMHHAEEGPADHWIGVAAWSANGFESWEAEDVIGIMCKRSFW